MPIASRHQINLQPKEREEIAALLSELERRGLTKEAQQLQKKLINTQIFHTDENGYFVRMDGKKFNPNNEGQSNFIASNGRFVAFIGPRGSGKSAVGAQKALRKLAQGQSGAVLNPDFENFKVSTWPEFRNWIPWGNVVPIHKYRMKPEWEPHQPFRLSFTNGASVICKGLKDADSARGPNINWLWYDEAGRDKDGVAWQLAIASVRIGESPQAWITTTPKGKLHWIYDFFISEEFDEQLIKEFQDASGGRELVEWFYSTVEQNAENLDPGFYASLRKAYVVGSYLYRQEVLGEFVTEGGSLGSRLWFKGKIIPEKAESTRKRVRYWDLAASEKKISGKRLTDPDETVGTLLSWDGKEEFCIEDQVAGRWEWADIKERIAETAVKDGVYVSIFVEEEPGAGGKNQVAELVLYIREKLGYSFKLEGHRPEGDKVMRALAWFAEASRGLFSMVFGTWNEPFLDQLDSFPEVKHDDKVDSVSGARQIIAPFHTPRHLKFLHLGSKLDENEKDKEKSTQEGIV